MFHTPPFRTLNSDILLLTDPTPLELTLPAHSQTNAAANADVHKVRAEQGASEDTAPASLSNALSVSWCWK